MATENRKTLFNYAMKGEWQKVKEIYKKNPGVRKEKITRSGSTAIHIAVSDGQEDTVKELVEIIYQTALPETEGAKLREDAKTNPIFNAVRREVEKKMQAAGDISNIEKAVQTEISKIEALFVEDERGHTPLHIAAELGSVKMCYSIAGGHPSLIAARNHEGETPLFLAAFHGYKDTFLFLHSVSKDVPSLEYTRRKDGDTILHCSISGDNYDLAFQIIHLYPNLVNSLNERGQSPLHLLAAKHSAFRSGCRLGRFTKIIYHCVIVDELKKVDVEMFSSQLNSKFTDGNEKTHMRRPENYETCCNFIDIVKDIVGGNTENAKKTGGADQAQETKDNGGASSRGNKEQTKKKGDLENPEVLEKTTSSQHQSKSTIESETNHELGSYKACLNLVTHLGELERGNEDAPFQRPHLFPINNESILEFVKLVYKAMLIILGLGSNEIKKIQEMKQRHTWSVRILDELLKNVSMYEYEDDGKQPLVGYETPFNLDTLPERALEEHVSDTYKKDSKDGTNTADSNKAEKQENLQEAAKSETSIAIKNGSTDIVQKIHENFPMAIHDMKKNKKVILTVENRQEKTMKETVPPVLIAAMNGITEIVERILQQFPVAIHDTNLDKKNIVLLAVENRQPHVYELLLEKKALKDSVFRKVDNKGNSALHLAGTLGEHKPWLIPGAALQMQWEFKWYEFVMDSMPFHFFAHYNKEGKTPKNIFTETHQDLVKAGGEWLINTSQSCSVVAALIATVAFATSSTVPGGVKEESGTPTLENQPAFSVFAISSLVALCFSVTALVMFLSILTSRYQERDFARDLPRKLLVGLTSLFVSIASMLTSFCAGHFFVLKDQLKYAAFPIYAVTCLPVTIFAFVQFPLYFDLIWATFKQVPQRSYRTITH